MFEQLQDRFNLIFRQLRGLGKITDKYINGYEEENKRIHKNVGTKMLF